MSGGEPVSGDGLIDPERFVCRGWDLDPDRIGEAAETLSRIGRRIPAKADQISWTWGQISAYYQAPEQEQVYELMGPANKAAREMGERLQAAAKAMEAYQSEMGWYKHVLLEFEGRAAAFRERALEGYSQRREVSPRETNVTGGTAKPAEYETVVVPWYEDLSARAENRRLLQEYAEILEKIQIAAAACAEAINAQRNTPVEAAPVVDADSLMASPQLMPWGNPEAGPNAGCWGEVGDAILDRLYGGWEDITRVAGFDPETFDPSRDWLAQRNNLTSFFTVLESVDALAVTVLAAFPATHLIPRGNAYFDAKRQQGIDNWAAMISYDTEAARNGWNPWHRYDTNFAGAWTDNVLNVGSLVLAVAAPTFGIPAFLRALRRASRREYDAPRPASPDTRPERPADPAFPGLAATIAALREQGVRIGTALTELFTGNRTPAFADGDPDGGGHGTGGHTLHTTSHHDTGTSTGSGHGHDSSGSSGSEHSASTGGSGSPAPNNAPHTPDDTPTTPGHGTPITTPHGQPDLSLYPDRTLPPAVMPDGTPPKHPGFPTTQYPPVGSNDGGTGHWSIVNRAGASSNSLDYQEGVTGVGGIGIPKPGAPDPASGIPLTGNDLLHRTLEYNQNGVHFDGHLWRQHPDGTPQETFLEAKAHYEFFLEPWAQRAGAYQKAVDDIHGQMGRQLEALPPGAKLEWHFQEESVANHIRDNLPDELQDVEVYWTP